MKKLLYIIVLAVALSSCDLNLEPKNATTFDHFFRNEDDLYALVAEMHGEMRTIMASVPYHEHMGARVDRIITSASVYTNLRNLDPNVIASRYSQQQWKRYYNALNLTDLFIDNYYKAKGVPTNRLNFCIGQSYFVRSVCYLMLARTWGDAVITTGSLNTKKYAKSPAKAVIDTAINSALKAYELLPKYSEMKGVAGRTLTSKQYGCKGSAAAILAHLYAWKGSVLNDEAALRESIFWSSKLLDPANQNEAGIYTMANDPEMVCTNTLVRAGAESIFELQINYFESDFSGFLVGAHLISYPVKRNSTPQDATKTNYGISLSMVNQMYGQNDKRRTAYFFEPDNSDVSNTLGLAYLYKWRYPLYRESGGGEPAMFRNMDCNKVLIRLADMYLLRAECRVKTGDNSGAIADLNVVRDRAGANSFPDLVQDENEAQLQRLIFREREKELLYEGQRYYDVVRNGYVRDELSEAFRNLTDAEIKNGALYLPVPESAFSDNDFMIQNGYWLSKMK